MSESFNCICLDRPARGAAPAIAGAAARAGGIGVVDFEFAHESANWQHTIRALARIVSSEAIGVRLTPAQILSHTDSAAQWDCQPHWLIVAACAGTQTLLGALAALPANAARRVLVEVTDIEQAVALSAHRIDGLIAKGSETGGPIGEDTAYILLQKLMSAGTTQVYVRGGIGVHGAAACRAAGAAGVVLDDQLLLLAETSLPRRHVRFVEGLSGRETIAVRDAVGAAWRVLPVTGRAASDGRDLTLDGADERVDAEPATFDTRRVGLAFDDPATIAWPCGQAIGFARMLRDRYATVGRVVRAFREETRLLAEQARAARVLAPESGVARSHGTRYPIAQGPMTRVSDTPQFAAAVADGGALPFLALALMRPEQVAELLEQTSQLLGARPWGVGLLGFVAPALREQQAEVVRRFKPSFALIAGGRPDQARELEQVGIPTYLHVPSPHLLEWFLEEGARRFVFEGRECGGHVGPFSSLVLWEHMVATLLERHGSIRADDLHVLFAGGIHDARSAAMASVMAAPLVARNIRVGVLMGTAYLFTEEAVATGAIVEGFQRAALACEGTALLDTGPGHSTRCARTPFIEQFTALQESLRTEGRGADEVREELEALNIGRLRIASKGLSRDQDGRLLTLDGPEQHASGLYMMGQVATQRSNVTSIAALHRAATLGAMELLAETEPRPADSARESARPSDVAIIGLGVLLPGAQTPQAYWKNIVGKRSAIREVPRERFDWRLYYDPDRHARDRIYSKWGGFIDEVRFDPTQFGIPPNSLQAIDPLQLLALEGVRRALVDAGYPDGGGDRERTAVILGAGGGLGEVGLHYGVRAELARVDETVSPQAWERLPEWTEESFPGCLLNVAAGRVANRFNFGGSNFTVDAACASSLAAVDLAVRELESGRSDLAIAGGVDTLQSPFAYLCFSKTQALSPLGQARTFDRNADGIVISEGVAIVVLKRLADAERDGDRIYAVIRAVASSSDGKALGLTAPLPAGQMRALDRAYRAAGFSPSTLGLIEAHGTGTPVGDRAETETVVNTLRAHGAAARTCAIGSVKTLIGHTKATAGAAGLVKTALALHHRVLPPHAGVQEPIEPLLASDCPVYLLEDARPWLCADATPRRAGISAFGFGGTNFHAVLEEYRGGSVRARTRPNVWPYELVVLSARTRDGLVRDLESIGAALGANGDTDLAHIAYTCALRADGDGAAPFRIAAVVHDVDNLREVLRDAAAYLRGETPKPPESVHLHVATGDESQSRPRLALLFPGQGSQYVNMLREATIYLDPLRDALEAADALFAGSFEAPLSRLLFPPAAFSAEEQALARRRVTDTDVAQPAIGALEAGCVDLLGALHVHADMAAGHSYGEYAALHAAEVFDRPAFLALSRARGAALARACNDDEPGTMAAVALERQRLTDFLQAVPGVAIANHNAPTQCVLSGPRAAVERVCELVAAEGIGIQPLVVAGAFHSHLMASAQGPLGEAIAGVTVHPPKIAVYGNETGAVYPSDPAQIREQLSRHLLGCVEFVQTVERMHDDGARVFLELGPGRVLSRLVRQILKGRSFRSVAMDDDGGGLRGVLSALGVLFAEGVPIQLAALFDRREVHEVDLAPPRQPRHERSVPQTTFFLTGSVARPAFATDAAQPRRPFLDREALDEAAEHARAPQAVASPPVGDAKIDTDDAGESAGAARLPQLPPLPETATGATEIGAALAEYQNVMRQFLSVQEKVMTHFLRGEPSEARVQSLGQTPERRVAVETSTSAQDGAAAAAAVTKNSGGDASPEPAAHRLDRGELLEVLLRLVSERTGYPRELLATDQDVEAELGIDSIKRVEILGALQRALPAPAAQVLRDSMDALTRAKTLDAIADRIAAPVATTSAPSEKAAPREQVGMPSADQASIDADAIGDLVREIAAARTGYPRELLGLDQDVEAELGIDSIKRVEILGALQKRLPSELAERVRMGMDTLTRAKTLSAIVRALTETEQSESGTAVPAANGPAAPAQSERREKQGVPESSASPSNPVPRFVLRAECAEPSCGVPLGRGLHVITGDELSVASHLAEMLDRAGAPSYCVSAEAACTPALLDGELRRARAMHGPVVAVVHLAGLSGGCASGDFAAWRTGMTRHVMSLHHVLRACASEMRDAAQGVVLTASAFGGAFARDGADAATCATAGGAVGMVKTVPREWPGTRARAVDFPMDWPPQRIARCIVDELQTGDDVAEVGYAAGERRAFRTVAAALEPDGPGLQLAPDDVVLVTGGARGISFEAALAFARFRPTLILVGRAPAPAAVEAHETAALSDANALRQWFIGNARTRDEQPAPAQIEQRVTAVLKAREIRRNLERLRALGARVEYHSVDLAEPDACGRLIADIRQRHGRLDGFVHGAGVIEDRLIGDKDSDQFERVFAAKAGSAIALTRHLAAAPPRFSVFFASVAGRFGNRGQSDYAAANETLNRLAWQLDRRWPHTRVVSINWGPWRAGMAVEPVLREFEERGIRPIDPDAGVRFLLDELGRGGKGEVEIVAGAGPWERLERDMSVSGRRADGPPSVAFPFVAGKSIAGEAGTITMQHIYSPASDPYLLDHCLDRAPVLPLTVVLEWLAEFVQSGWPHLQLAEVRDLRVLKGIVLRGGEACGVQLRARSATHADADAVSVSAEIIDTRRDLAAYRATLTLRHALGEAPVFDAAPLRAGNPMRAEQAYREYLFHGPQFRRLTDIGAISADGIDATAAPTHPAEWLHTDAMHPGDVHDWLFDPALLDTAPQLAIVWSRVHRDVTAVPNRFGRVRRWHSDAIDGPVKVALRIRGGSGDSSVDYDASFVDASGRLLLHLEHAESACSAALNRLALQTT